MNTPPANILTFTFNQLPTESIVYIFRKSGRDFNKGCFGALWDKRRYADEATPTIACIYARSNRASNHH